jgi:predicted amidophosphoribosyltransferase
MFVPAAISKLYDAALAIAYPQACAVCEGSVESRDDGVACAGCWQETRLLTDQDTVCWKCGALTFHFIGDDRREEILCHRCDDRDFDFVRACGIYEGALRASLIELKRVPNISRRLSALLHEASLRPPLNRATVIVPVPLHTQRERACQSGQVWHVTGRNKSALVENCLLEWPRPNVIGLGWTPGLASVAGAFC